MEKQQFLFPNVQIEQPSSGLLRDISPEWRHLINCQDFDKCGSIIPSITTNAGLGIPGARSMGTLLANKPTGSLN